MSERVPTWAKKPPQKCGTCKHLRPRSDGKPFYHGHVYQCLWTMPEMTFPDSWQYHQIRNPKRLTGMSMSPSDGKDCPCWEPAP